MSLKKNIQQLLAGHPYSQEYLCMQENSMQPVAYFTEEGTEVPHLFLGYKPLLFATKKNIRELQLVQKKGTELLHLGSIQFTPAEIQFPSLPDTFFYIGKSSKSYLSHGLKEQVAKSYYHIKAKKNDPLYLDLSLYNQVRLAYSIPRKISLITLGNGHLYNVCPTDLHGTLDNQHYMISLRKNGQLNAQVNEFKKLLLADIDASYYKEAYQLGKNHMQGIKEPGKHTSLTQETSSLLRLPIPQSCMEYKELQWITSIEVGIHQIHLFSIVNHQKIQPGNRLMHVHAYYAAWRKRRKYTDEFLFR
jgi:hypothetical protein